MGERTVILAAGDFPRKGGEARRLLASARRVVACDSAAAAYRRHFGRWPTVIVGDLDSCPRQPTAVEVVRVPEQETNDLEKAMALCAARGWRDVVIVGATGKREDHAIGNVFRALVRGLPIVTDHGRFEPVRGCVTLRVRIGAAISIFAPVPRTCMTSRGLEWPLDGHRFRDLFGATLNRATAARVMLTSTRPAFAYIAFG